MMNELLKNAVEDLLRPSAQARAQELCRAFDNDWSLLESVLELIQDMDIDHLEPIEQCFYKMFVECVEQEQQR